MTGQQERIFIQNNVSKDRKLELDFVLQCCVNIMPYIMTNFQKQDVLHRYILTKFILWCITNLFSSVPSLSQTSLERIIVKVIYQFS